MAAQQGSHNLNIEVFVNKQLDIIQVQASGRSQQHKELRDTCQQLKGTSQSSFITILITLAIFTSPLVYP